MHRSRAMGLEILSQLQRAGDSQRSWRTSASGTTAPAKTRRSAARTFPLSARMIAIVEAFDAMTTDHVYRPALSQERAMAELFHCAGTQFDPKLVRQFAEFRESDLSQLRREVAGQWLGTLDPEMVNSYWEHNCVPSPPLSSSVDAAFHARLLDNMYDAVVFIDAAGKIMLWNHGAERLTGIAGTSVCQQRWGPEVLNMADEKGQAVAAGRLPGAGGVAVGGAIAAAAGDLRPHGPPRLRRYPRHSRLRRQRRHPRRHPAVARRLVGNVAGAAMPEPARKGHPRSAHPGRQPRRVRSRPRNVHRGAPAAAGPLQPADVRPGPFQVGQRHLRPPGGRRRHQERDDPVEGRVPAGRPGGPLRRRRIRHALRRLRQRRRRPARRTGPHGAGPNAPAENERPARHRQLRRHRDSTGRHRGNHAPPRGPGLADGQGQGTQHRRPARNRRLRSDRAKAPAPASPTSPPDRRN